MPCNLGIKDAAMLAFKDLKVSKTALVRVSEMQDNHLKSMKFCFISIASDGEE